MTAQYVLTVLMKDPGAKEPESLRLVLSAQEANLIQLPGAAQLAYKLLSRSIDGTEFHGVQLEELQGGQNTLHSSNYLGVTWT